jgi:hypothetical protein
LVEFISKAYDGLTDVYNAAHFVLDTDEISVYLRLYLLLYADDTVILAESKVELQTALNAIYLYCKTWNLEVNASKTKAVIFNKRKISDKPVFTLNGEILNVVDDFAYLGIILMSNGSFSKNRVSLLEQGRKAMFSMLRKCRSLGLPILDREPNEKRTSNESHKERSLGLLVKIHPGYGNTVPGT